MNSGINDAPVMVRSEVEDRYTVNSLNIEVVVIFIMQRKI